MFRNLYESQFVLHLQIKHPESVLEMLPFRHQHQSERIYMGLHPLSCSLVNTVDSVHHRCVHPFEVFWLVKYRHWELSKTNKSHYFHIYKVLQTVIMVQYITKCKPTMNYYLSLLIYSTVVKNFG